jgi:hypothetical protein
LVQAAPQGGRHRGRRLEAVGRVFGQRLVDDLVEPFGQLGTQRSDGLMRFVRDHEHEGGHRGSAEGQLAGQQLIQANTQRE